jgi:hypothetical protein
LPRRHIAAAIAPTPRRRFLEIADFSCQFRDPARKRLNARDRAGRGELDQAKPRRDRDHLQAPGLDLVPIEMCVSPSLSLRPRFSPRFRPFLGSLVSVRWQGYLTPGEKIANERRFLRQGDDWIK